MTLGTAPELWLCSTEEDRASERSVSRSEALADMGELLHDGRAGMLVCGVTIAAVTLGFALEEPQLARALHAGAAVVCVVLLIALAASVVRTATLMIAAGSPLVDELGELRRRTGAPVDLSAPWIAAGGSAGPFPASGWEHVRVVLAAAHVRSVRIHRALIWASISAGCFFVWTLAVLALA